MYDLVFDDFFPIAFPGGYGPVGYNPGGAPNLGGPQSSFPLPIPQ